jgi:hypothetical protein
MNQKLCNRCSNFKPLSDFYKVNKGANYCSHCKTCDKLKCSSHRAKNNGKVYKKLRSEQYLKNKERENELRKLWDQSNRRQKNALCAKYRAKKLNATIGNYENEIEALYKECPKGYHVDHIVPLQGENVSGLHVPWNLRIITAEENLKKGNRLV